MGLEGGQVDENNSIPCSVRLNVVSSDALTIFEFTHNSQAVTLTRYSEVSSLPSFFQDSQPVPFRYTVVPNRKVNCMEPKPLAASVNLGELRATMFGAALLTDGCGLSKLPQTSHSSIVWEACIFIFRLIYQNLTDTFI